MNRKTIVWVVVILVVSLIGFRIVTSKKKQKAVDADTGKPVYTQKAARGTISNAIKVSGNIAASQQADVFARVPGKLISNLVEEGEYVSENQEIALIDRDEIGVRFTTATVKSSIAGVVLKHFFDPGTKISPMAAIATIGNIKKLKCVINLPESDFIKIKPGQKVFISVDAYPDNKIDGSIVSVSPQIDLMSRTGQAEIMIDNAAGKLKPGMFATVEIRLVVHSGVIVIPRSSVLEDGELRKVFIVEDGMAKEKNVNVGIFNDDNSEILSGLKPGDELIIEGHHSVKDGDKVRIVTE